MKYRLITDVDEGITYVMHEKTGMYFKYAYLEPSHAKIVQNNLELGADDKDMRINHVENQADVLPITANKFEGK